MQPADAVVIGAGINGAATAYNLIKRAGIKNVVLLEKQLIASGGTGRSAAIIRQHYSNEELVRLVKRSVDIFDNFDDEVGGDDHVGRGLEDPQEWAIARGGGGPVLDARAEGSEFVWNTECLL